MKPAYAGKGGEIIDGPLRWFLHSVKYEIVYAQNLFSLKISSLHLHVL